jgi:hypothetical protein
MAATLPPFSVLWANYPTDIDPELVKKAIGGKVDLPWIKNTCAIRMSRALNKGGYLLPKSYPGLNVISGADGHWYAFRVSELKLYLEKVFGKPKLDYKNTRKSGTAPALFQSKKGIIVFEVDQWSDATGHITLWNGNQCRANDCYWDKAHTISLWEML